MRSACSLGYSAEPNKHSMISSSGKYSIPIAWGFVLKANLVINHWTTPNLARPQISHVSGYKKPSKRNWAVPQDSRPYRLFQEAFQQKLSCSPSFSSFILLLARKNIIAISVMLRSLLLWIMRIYSSSDPEKLNLLHFSWPQPSPLIILKRKEEVINKLYKSKMFSVPHILQSQASPTQQDHLKDTI